MKKENLKIDGYRGTWYVIDECWFKGQYYYQLESEQDGDECPWIIVDKDFKIVKSIYGDNIDDCYDDMGTTLQESLGE